MTVAHDKSAEGLEETY